MLYEKNESNILLKKKKILDIKRNIIYINYMNQNNMRQARTKMCYVITLN